LNEPEAQKTLDGDRYVGSMREAVDATLAALERSTGIEGL
jgi:hypothetical protein